jgi:dipeptidyl aminopeptidase/acylaminoacyl peptidase
MKQRACLFFLFLLVACQPMPAFLTATLPAPRVVIETVTPSPIPTETLTPSPTPTVDELIFPYTIEGLRKHDYQSGDIHIRSTLDENDLYTSYLIDYPSDGLTITGVMQIPVGEGPFPVIVMNHGFFARSIYNSGDGTDRSSAFLAERGYITLASDYRSWAASDEGESFFYSGLVIDVINLINAIPSIPQADPSRVGIWGHSMGGGVTMKVLTVIGGFDTPYAIASDYSTTVNVKAAVLYSTVSADFGDIIARWGMGCFGDIAAGELIVGCNSSDVIPVDLPLNLQEAYRFTANDADALKKVSPLYHLENITVPIQIHYGTEDGQTLSGTPPEWSVTLTQVLRDAGKYAELYQYEGERHSFISQPWFDFMERVVRFFDKNVKNA